MAFYIYAKWLGQTDDQNTIRFLENRLNNVLDEMNDVWLETQYMAGEEMTVADIFAACDIEQISMILIKVADQLLNVPGTRGF